MRTTAWITGILAIAAGLVVAGSPCFAIDTPDSGYKLVAGEPDKKIDLTTYYNGGVCRQARSSQSLFVPTKQQNEWNRFTAGVPGGKVNLSACSYCGDGTCDPGESCSTCPGDCGACAAPPPPPPRCGDAICNGGETCSSCPVDCGACAAPPTCSDGIQNQGETGVDCGGPCAACPPSPVCSVPQHFSCYPSGTTCGADDWGRQVAGCSGGCGDDSSQNSIALHWDNATGQGQCWWDARPVNPPYTFATFGECFAQRDACWPH